MDNIATMLPDAEVPPGLSEQTSDKAALVGLIEYMPLFMILICLSLFCAVGLMSSQTVVDESVTKLPDLMKSLAQWQRMSLIFCFMVWVITMGCIGGVSSLGMQAIKVPGVTPLSTSPVDNWLWCGSFSAVCLH